MSQSFSRRESYFLQQGVKALMDETHAQRAALVSRIHPEDNNLTTLLEYYDKRMAELKAISEKLVGLVST